LEIVVISALQILDSRPYRQRLTLKQIDELAKAIERPPRSWTADRRWQAYQVFDRSIQKPEDASNRPEAGIRRRSAGLPFNLPDKSEMPRLS
jgi:hypothetical protein